MALSSRSISSLSLILVCLLTTYSSCPSVKAISNSSKTWMLHKFSVKRKNYSVTVKYPVFNGSNSIFKRLNTKISRIALQQYREAIKKHLSDKSRQQEPLGEFVATYDVKMASRAATSLSCELIDYTPDAATSCAEIQTLNYSLSPFRKLQIDDLFKAGVDYQKALKVISMSKLFAATANSAWSFNTCGDDIEKFAMDKNGIILFFTQDTPNEVLKIKIPIRQIRNLMDDALVKRTWSRHELTNSDSEQILEVENLNHQLAIIAIGTYSAMINANPSNALAYRQRGKWYQELGRAEVAEKDLEEANRLSPE